MGLFSAAHAGNLDRVTDFRLGIGGAESNVAIGVVRLGRSSTWIGRVGADGVGDLIHRELRAEGVETSAIVDSTAPTGLMIKHRPIEGVSKVLYHRQGSAGSRLHPHDIDVETVRTAKVLHITGITPALSPSASATIDRAVRVASEAGIAVSFDVNHRAALWREGGAAQSHRRLAANATILFAGLEEARMLIGRSDVGARDAAALLATRGGGADIDVIIKLGEQGCLALIDRVEFELPAVPIHPVDTVGAGDAFVAGYLAEYASDAPATARLYTAVRAGAYACLGPGDWESLPRRPDLALLDGGEPVER